jgi:type II secretory ATPase GspE/PulE/Tfp pilus assembly ATPase PilB-like protein/putative methionine-R-sulfoxide reductase with GAF domain
MAENEFLDLVSDLKGQLEEKIILEEMNKTICSSFDFDEILVCLRDNTCKLLECDRATIYVVERNPDGGGRELVSRSFIGEELQEIRVPYSHASIAGACACQGTTLRIDDVYDDDELANLAPGTSFDRTWDERSGYRSKSMLVAPARRDDYVVGVVQALNKTSGAFTPQDEELMGHVTEHLAAAIANNRSQTRVHHRRSRKTVEKLLVEKGFISEAKLEEAVERSREEHLRLTDLLTDAYDIPEIEITRCMAEINELEVIEFDSEDVPDPSLFDNVPEAYAKRHLICPYRLTMDSEGTQQVQLVMHNPKDFVAQEDVELRTGWRVSDIYMATKSDILAMIQASLHPEQVEESEEAMGDLVAELAETLGIEEQAEDVEAVSIQEGTSEEDGPIVRLANRIIEEAVRRGATDIHIEPKEKQVLVRYRIDGSLEKSLTFPHHAKRAIVSRFKIMADCNITERRIPQDGRIRFKEHGGRYNIELRVNICPTVGDNEDVVMRILADSKPLPLEKLGLLDYTYEPLTAATEKPYGMILCVGPTGSGKTTTLHSAVAHINTPERKILTAENPVEITQDGLRQVQIRPDVGLSFKAALRAFLRQDPDVILVGEMRDFETCSIAVEAALTGHLLLSTLHTNNAPETVTRLVDIGIDPVTLADALLVVLAQRLGKTLCKKCKERYEPEDEELAEAGFSRGANGVINYLDEEWPDAEFYKAVGCPACQGRGYKGRVGIHEILNNNEEITRIIATGGKVAEIRQVARDAGMRELYEDGMIKVLKGMTSIHQIRAVCIE